MGRLSLGLDLSTQSLTAVVVDIEELKVISQTSLDYRADSRLNGFTLTEDYILPPREPGEALQPVSMYLGALDAVMTDLKADLAAIGRGVSEIVVINIAAQQHGHVFLGEGAPTAFGGLNNKGKFSQKGLGELLANAFSVPFARIWRTSNTKPEAALVRDRVGGARRLIEISGSDAPLRFSAFGIRKTAQEVPPEYVHTRTIHQLNSLMASVLTGDSIIPLDFGSACGTSLMDYVQKAWSPTLLAAVAEDLPGGVDALTAKLPRLASAKTLVARIARYFVERYGFSPECLIGIGSGDNPQTKVLVGGSLFSLGTSFVIMADTDGRTFDYGGNANAMYDALDRPFMFGCRTNGGLRWDNVRAMYGMAKQDYAQAEIAMQRTPLGNNGRLFLWQAEEESFPRSGIFGPIRIGYTTPDLASDYTGIIESTLGSVYLFSRHFMAPEDTLFVTGGATRSRAVLLRVAAIWARTVIPIGAAGAALGAAVSGAYALLTHEGRNPSADEFAAHFVERKPAFRPSPEDVNVYHCRGGVLDRINEGYTQGALTNPNVA